jgi:folate-dependent phosphoribosylglycinamide formyltransferase PurN
MDILFLGYNRTQTTLIDFIKSKGHTVVQSSDIITKSEIKLFDFIISFGYTHIIHKDVIDEYKYNNLINLHISYLPYNRGSHPNFWAFHDGTPSGVTIHLVDSGIDTGEILLQKKCKFDITQETFKSTYNKLIIEIENLFKSNYENILYGRIKPKKQSSQGTFHRKKDIPVIKNWDINIHEYLNMNSKTRSDNEIINDIENIRSKNNVNWMDAVRLCFELDPTKARQIFKNIKDCDYKINELINELATNEKHK